MGTHGVDRSGGAGGAGGPADTSSADVTFEQSGTLTASRTAQAKMREWFSVDDYSTATIAGAVAAIGATDQRLVLVPASYSGADPAASGITENISLFDLRRSKTLIGNPSDIKASVLYDFFAGTGAENRVFGLAAELHATAGGTSGNGATAECVAFFAAAERTGGNRPIWAANFVVEIGSGQRTNAVHGLEIDFNNNDTDVTALDNTAANTLNGLSIISGGSKKPATALRIQSSTAAGRWLQGILVANWSDRGISIVQDSAATAVTNPALYIIPSSNGTNTIVTLRNAADGADIWYLKQDGTQVMSANLGLYASPSFEFDLNRASVGATVTGRISNSDNSDAASAARLVIQVGGSTADDQYILFSAAAWSEWALGQDASDSDSFVLSKNGTLGTNNAFRFDGSLNATFGGSIKTSAPSGGTAASWKLGAVASISPTSPDRTIEVDVGGTIYYLHAKTTNN